MRIPRVSLPGPIEAGTVVDLPPAESHHLRRVLRRRSGDPVELLPETGGLYEGRIAGASGERGEERVSVEVLRELSAAERSGQVIPWTVAVAMVKGEGLELSIRAAAELGLERIVPLLTERTVIRPTGSAGRLERYRRIALEAAKQCGRSEPLEVEEARTLDTFLEGWRSRPAPPGEGLRPRGWILSPGAPFCPEILAGGDASAARPEPAPMPGVSVPRVSAARGAAPTPPGRATFLIGPEGGFSAGELDRARAAGFEPLGLPTPVLRTPTAVILVAALGALARGLGETSGPGAPAGSPPEPGRSWEP